MATLAELIARAEQIAEGRGGDPERSPVIDAGLTAEALYPHALRYCISREIRGGSRPADEHLRSHYIEIRSGEGDLPATVLKEFLDRAYLPDLPRTSWVPFTDYARPRHDNLLGYWTVRGRTFLYSGSTDPADGRDLSALDGTFVAGIGSASVTAPGAAFVAGEVGDRIRIVSPADVLSVDAFIDSVAGDVAVVRGRAMTDEFFGFATLYEGSAYTVGRSLTSVNTTANSKTVTCAGGAFSSLDVGRRLRISQGGSYILDAIIETVADDSEVSMTAYANATSAVADADVMYHGVELAAVSVPDTPTSASADLGIEARLADSIVVAMAAALTGEMTLAELIRDY